MNIVGNILWCKPRGTGSGQKNAHWEQQTKEEMALRGLRYRMGKVRFGILQLFSVPALSLLHEGYI